eukprot:6214342-Amphidinium_carterae.1
MWWVLSCTASIFAVIEWGEQPAWCVALLAPPMGDIKAPDIAQCVHSHLAVQAEVLTLATWMVHGSVCPSGPTWSGCYVDDYGQISVLDSRVTGQFNATKVAAEASATHGRLLCAYESAQIERKVAKATLDEEKAVVWGAHLDGPQRRVESVPHKRRLLVLATLEASRCQHHLAFHRASMCVLDHTYGWLQCCYRDGKLQKKGKKLTRRVRDEL